MRRICCAALTVFLSAAPAAAQTHLLVVSGLGGAVKYSEAFHRWATTMIDAALDRYGLPESNVVYLAEKVERDSARIRGRSTKENVLGTLASLAERAGPDDQIFILLIGHGSVRDGEPRINLPGPDMTASDFASALEPFRSQRIAFVNATSASGDFIGALSGENRAIITATKSGYERNETLFARYFVEAFAQDVADSDKDGRVSVLEAFNYARREVARLYESENRLLSEHALLDDNADGVGSGEPDIRGPDGALAGRLFLAGATGVATASGPIADPELAALYRDKRALEEEIAALRARKDEMESQAYELELERLLLDLALKTRAIRDREGGGT